MGMAEIWISLPFQYLFGNKIQVFLYSEIILSIFISLFIYYCFTIINHKLLGLIFSVLFQVGHPFLNSHLMNPCENFSISILLGLSGFYFLHKFQFLSEPNSEKYLSEVGFTFFLYGFTLGFAVYNREILILFLPVVLLLNIKYFRIIFRGIFHIVIGFLLGYLPGILHYFLVPYTNKLIKPKVVFQVDIFTSIRYFLNTVLFEVYISGSMPLKIFFIIGTIIGILFLFFEKVKILKLYFYYYILGVLFFLSMILFTKNYTVHRYYFMLPVGSIFFSSYGLYKLLTDESLKNFFSIRKVEKSFSFIQLNMQKFFNFILFKFSEKNPYSFLKYDYSIFYRKYYLLRVLLYSIILIVYFHTFTLEWKRNLELAGEEIQFKNLTRKLLEKKVYYGFGEYWIAHSVAYFSENRIKFLIYLDKQSDLKSTYQVILNKANFFIFTKNSEYENYFLKNTKKLSDYTREEFYHYTIYFTKEPTLDFLEDSREILLEELERYLQ